MPGTASPLICSFSFGTFSDDPGNSRDLQQRNQARGGRNREVQSWLVKHTSASLKLVVSVEIVGSENAGNTASAERGVQCPDVQACLELQCSQSSFIASSSAAISMSLSCMHSV